MCGIAGRILRTPGPVGRDLVALMEAQEHRGADSTGFAVYGLPLENGFILRGMGFNKKRIDDDLAALQAVLIEHNSDFLTDPILVRDTSQHYHFRIEIRIPTNIPEFIADADELAEHIEIQSCGRSLEIIKDVGSARVVSEKHGVYDMIGTHGLGHARLATESSVLPNASHPFWARPFSDVAIVHNGQITDYVTWRGKLQRKGYSFLTENDSELIAVWVSDQMKSGLTLDAALTKSISAIDGVFTYMIATFDTICFAKDRFAMKPLVALECDSEIAAATEEQAMRRVFQKEVDVINYDGPGLTGIWPIKSKDIAA